MLVLTAHTVFAVEDAVHPSELSLERIFKDKEFRVERYGPARWLEDGSGYTTLEPSPEFDEAKDIVRYDPATGERSVLVPAASLLAEQGAEPLSIKDYQWSDDGKELLVFTNS